MTLDPAVCPGRCDLRLPLDLFGERQGERLAAAKSYQVGLGITATPPLRPLADRPVASQAVTTQAHVQHEPQYGPSGRRASVQNGTRWGVRSNPAVQLGRSYLCFPVSHSGLYIRFGEAAGDGDGVGIDESATPVVSDVPSVNGPSPQ